MNIPFTKTEWTGNDFIIIDLFDGKNADIILTKERIQKMCDRNFWIWSDGILLVKNWQKEIFEYQMFNPDGSEAEMCGNGIRCYMKYIVQKWYLRESVTKVETKKWVLTLSLDWDFVRVDMGKPILKDSDIPVREWVRKVESHWREFEFIPVSMWNPHAVIFIDEILEDFDLIKYGSVIENNTQVFPKKVNVEFVNIISRCEIQMRVYERGAGETLACGTGACASVVAGILRWDLDTNSDITVHLRGWNLHISWWGNSDDSIIMSWPANIVFEWIYSIN